MHFDGATYEPTRDKDRLTFQYQRTFDLMKDAEWRTLADIAAVTNDPTPSVGARLRDMRKERFGAHTVNRRYLGDGLFEYQLEVR